MKIIITNIKCTCIIGGIDNKNVNVFDELDNYLKVRPANYSMMLMQMRRRGIKGWDGYTHFLSKSVEFATGFLPMVLTFLKDLGVPIMLEDKRVNVPEFKRLPYNYQTPTFTLAEHQQQLLIKSNNYLSNITKTHIWNLYFPRGIWKAATNSGKTAAAGNLLLNMESPCAIMLLDNQDLLKQHYKYYRTIFKKDELGYITSKEIKPGSILTLAMVRTVYNRIKKSMTVQRDLNNRFNILLVDECHSYTGKEAVYVINKINAGMRIAMSGTPLDGSDKIGKFRLIGMFGDVLYDVSKRYLMDHGFSLIPNIHFILNPTTTKALTYDQEFADIVTESEQRAELIADIICKHRKQKVLITYFEHKHGKLMYDTFCYRYPTLAHLAEVVHGTDTDREKKIAAYIANEKTILFGSTILQQGINIIDIEVGINAMAEKSAVSVSQWCGRMERVEEGKTHFEWYDVWDTSSHMTKHSRRRLQLYKKEDYPTEIQFHYNNRRGVPVL